MKKKERNFILIILTIVGIAFALETHNENENKEWTKKAKEIIEAKEAKRIQDSLKILTSD